MKSTLAFLIAVSFYSQSSASACPLFPGKDAPVRGPRFIVAEGEAGASMTLKGPAAKAIFEHLTHSLVQVQRHWLAEKRTGYGMDCSRRYRWDGFHYSCTETLADGQTVAKLPWDKAVKDESQLLFLKLQGAELETLFDSMTAEANPEKLPNGVTAYKKISNSSTCTRYVDSSEKVTFVCEQILSRAGYAWSTGTAPMIGAGTLPVRVDVD